MKFYQQEGASLKRTNLAESDHICECCEDFTHGSHESLHDDAVCAKCSSLCCCSCHRIKKSDD